MGAPRVNGRAPPRFMPFAQGSRDCVGQTLARLNLSTTLPQLYGNFTFRLAEEVRRGWHACSRGFPNDIGGCSQSIQEKVSVALAPFTLITSCSSHCGDLPEPKLSLNMVMSMSEQSRGCCTVARVLVKYVWQLRRHFPRMQMGGPKGVAAAEMTSITLSCAKGMKVHCIPRVPAK